MKRRLRVLLAVGLLIPVMALSGCLFNIFQTAKMVQSGDVSILIGSGVMPITIDVDTSWSATPQARLVFGLSDTINLGLHTGVMIPFSSGEPGWLGVMGDLKFSLVDNPESIALAVGIGAGYGIHFLGWGVFGEVFFDLNVFPLYIAYQPTLPLSGEGFAIWHDVAIGLALNLSEKARLLIEVDTRNLSMLISYGLGFEIIF